MFAVIRHYHFDPMNSAEIDTAVRENFVPLVSKAKGFVRYYWLDTGKGEGASVSVFKDKAGAEESVPRSLRLSKGRSRPTTERWWPGPADPIGRPFTHPTNSPSAARASELSYCRSHPPAGRSRCDSRWR